MEIFIAILIIVFTIIIFFIYPMGAKTRENQLISLFRSHLYHADDISRMNCIFCEEEKKEKILEETNKKSEKAWKEKVGEKEEPKLSRSQRKDLKDFIKKHKTK